MKHQITPELLHKYLDGNCSPQETFLLYQWYDSFNNGEDTFNELNDTEQMELKNLMLNNFKDSLGLADTKKRGNSKKLFYFKWTGAVLAAVALLFCGVFILKQHAQKGNAIAANTINSSVLVSNKTNTIYRHVLNDGSIVWLNPKSSLQYPSKFTGKFREVNMTGEAFFEVKKDHSHPFIIYSGEVVTKVWGTSFRIKAYTNVPTEVSVLTGKVSVKIPEKDNSEIMLMPTEKITYVKHNLFLKKGVEKKSAMKIWQKASLAFDNVPLQNVFNKLNSHFGVRIYTSDDELGRYLFKADFTDQSLPAILDMMESSLDITYVLDNEEIVIYKKGPATN